LTRLENSQWPDKRYDRQADGARSRLSVSADAVLAAGEVGFFQPIRRGVSSSVSCRARSHSRARHVLLFNSARKKQVEAQQLLLRLLNQQHHAANLRAANDRHEHRSNTTVPVMIVPYVSGRPLVDEAIPATTKDLSAMGIGLVARQPVEVEEVLIGFRSEDEIFFIRAQVKHQQQISADFYQIGASTIEALRKSDFPLLAKLPL
jgi:hypothetical protein